MVKPVKIDPALLDHVRQLFGRAVYSHKTHEKDRERLSRLGLWLKWLNVVVGALTLGGIVTVLLGSMGQVQLVVSATLATVNVGLSLVQLSFDPLREASLHREAAKRLLLVRDGYETLIADIVGGDVTDDRARSRRDELQKQGLDAYVFAPDTSPRAYARAQKALKVSEDMTFSTAEIDAFLPEALRENSR